MLATGSFFIGRGEWWEGARIHSVSRFYLPDFSCCSFDFGKFQQLFIIFSKISVDFLLWQTRPPPPALIRNIHKTKKKDPKWTAVWVFWGKWIDFFFFGVDVLVSNSLAAVERFLLCFCFSKSSIVYPSIDELKIFLKKFHFLLKNWPDHSVWLILKLNKQN